MHHSPKISTHVVQAPAPAPATLRKAGLSDISSAFNLLQDVSADGYINEIYIQPRYQAGLALQLFSVCLMGRIRLPDGLWSHAALTIARRDGGFAGLILTRHLDAGGARREIYICAVAERFRSQGLGRQLVSSQLALLGEGDALEAQCLPKAQHMKRLLRSLGFDVCKADAGRQVAGAAQGFILRSRSSVAVE